PIDVPVLSASLSEPAESEGEPGRGYDDGAHARGRVRVHERGDDDGVRRPSGGRAQSEDDPAEARRELAPGADGNEADAEERDGCGDPEPIRRPLAAENEPEERREDGNGAEHEPDGRGGRRVQRKDERELVEPEHDGG